MNLRMFLLGCCAALALGVATVASAAAPVVTDTGIALHSLGADPVVSDACGFDVEVLNEGRIRTLEYADGSIQQHHQETFYWQANDRALTERVSFTMTRNGSETAFRGTVFHVVVPGVGPVLVEAGQAVFGPNGAIVRIAGLHQVLEGAANPQALCDYLSG